jgi:hypothetical protein
MSMDPRPPSVAFFDLFLQLFVVLLVEVIYILCQVYSWVFEFFEAIVNGIVFLYSFSVCSLLVYRKATDFCKLILYPATLLKLFMVFRSFWEEFFFWSLKYKIMSSVNRDSLTISLPICIPFVSSSCLISCSG